MTTDTPQCSSTYCKDRNVGDFHDIACPWFEPGKIIGSHTPVGGKLPKEFEEKINFLLNRFDQTHSRSVYGNLGMEIKEAIGSELLTAHQKGREEGAREERERLKNARDYLLDIEIPECEANLDLNIRTNIFSMKIEDRIKAEIIANRLRVWTAIWVDKLEKELNEQLKSLTPQNGKDE